MLTRGEVEQLLAQPRGTEPAALRDRALLELMYACGLRASEAIGLEVADVDLEDARAARPRQGLEGAGGAGRAGRRGARARLPRARAARAGGAASRRTCSSTSAAGRSPARGSTRSFAGTP